jgi:hypothetical protein
MVQFKDLTVRVIPATVDDLVLASSSKHSPMAFKLFDENILLIPNSYIFHGKRLLKLCSDVRQQASWRHLFLLRQ